MSNLPRDARIQTLHDIGMKIDDGLEQAKIQTARREAARTAHTDAVNHLVSSSTDQSLDKNTILHCVKMLQQLITTSSALYFTALGAEKQCEAHVAIIKKMYDLEVALKTREEIPPSPEELAVPRAAPPRTLKEMRLAEAAAAAAIPTPAPVQEKTEETKISPPDAEKPEAPPVIASVNNTSEKKPMRNKKKISAEASDLAIEIDVDMSGVDEKEAVPSLPIPKKSKAKKKKKLSPSV